MKQDLGLAGRLAHAFLNSKLTPLFIAASLALGIFAVAIIPREEEPQILVPMLDITTAMPGASPAEVEERVTLPIENSGASDFRASSMCTRRRLQGRAWSLCAFWSARRRKML